jgi:DNA polymerase elongation subunit (family B)
MAKCKFAALTNPDDWENETSRTVALALNIGKSSVNDHRAATCKCYRTGETKLSETAKNVRVLTIDIETSPNLAYVWGMFKQNVALTQLVEAGQVICWAASWYGEDPMFMSDHHDGHDQMVKGAWDLLNEADIVVHYNGTSFDIPHLNREFALAGLTPPKPYKQVDLLRTARKQFRFPSNKLDHVAQALGVGAKVSHTGFQLWIDCMADDPEAWELMRTYNLGDIKVTEALYDKLRPWIPNHPHLGMFTGSAWSCPNCGHKGVSKQRTGHIHTNVQTYRGYQCPNCHTHIRGTKALADATHTRRAA